MKTTIPPKPALNRPDSEAVVDSDPVQQIETRLFEKLKWGIMGTGMIAKKFARDLAESQTGELLAVGSRAQETADAFGDEFNVPRRYPSYDDLLADPDVQAIYNSLPNHMHVEWTVKCAEAGKHILCEKPLTTNHAEAMTLIEACQYHDVFMMEAFMYRCHPQTAKLVEVIKAGTIGQVRVIQAHFSYNMQPRNLANIRFQNEAAGGAIMDIGCYCASMSRLVAGAALGLDGPAEPVSVEGVGHIDADTRVDEWSVATLKFPNDIIATLVAGTQVTVDATLRVWGTEGHILVPNPWFPRTTDDSARFEIHRPGHELEVVTAAGGAPLYALEADVVAKHLTDRQAPSPSMTWDDSLGNLQTLDQWRSAVGLVFDREKTDAQKTPSIGRPPRPREGHSMTYGEVPGVNKPVSRIVMGSMVYRHANMPFACAMLDNYIENGGTTIDTAHLYGGGESEKAVGQWINLRGNREDIVLIGKGAASMDCTPEQISRELEISLDRLQLDYVDIYLMHRDNVNVPVNEFVDCLNEHKAAGRIRAFGGSNWSFDRLDQTITYAKLRGLTPFTVSSPNFSLAEWNEPMWDGCVAASDPESRAWYEKTQMPLFAWSSQASGFFTGRFAPGDHGNADMARVWYNEKNFDRLRRAKELGERKGVDALQIALAYVLATPLNSFALCGPRTIEELRTSLLALHCELSPEEVRWLSVGM